MCVQCVPAPGNLEPSVRLEFCADLTGLGVVEWTAGRLQLFICLLVLIAAQGGQSSCLGLHLR